MNELATNQLPKLAEEINDAHDYCNEAFKHTLNHAISAGENLLEAKELCGHGDWLEWREININHPGRTSRMYMRFGRWKEHIVANWQLFANLGLVEALKQLPDYKGVLSSARQDWYTPKIYMDAVHEVMGGIDLDPASCMDANNVVQATKFYSETDDGLSQAWEGRVFLNPPYGKGGPPFVEKLYNSIGSSVPEAIVLLNSRATETDWFQPCFQGVLCFTDHRIDFNSPEEKKNSSTHGSVFVYFGKNKKKFAEVFSKFGNVTRRWPVEEGEY